MKVKYIGTVELISQEGSFVPGETYNVSDKLYGKFQSKFEVLEAKPEPKPKAKPAPRRAKKDDKETK